MNDLSSAMPVSAPDQGGQLLDDETPELVAELGLPIVGGGGRRTDVRCAGQVAGDRVRRDRAPGSAPRQHAVERREDLLRVPAVSDPRDVDQVLRLEVLPEGAPTGEAGA